MTTNDWMRLIDLATKDLLESVYTICPKCVGKIKEYCSGGGKDTNVSANGGEG